MENKNESRRDFITHTSRMVITAGLATIAGSKTAVSAKDKKPALGKSTMTIQVDISDPANTALQLKGGAIYIENPSEKDRPIIIYRKGENEATAFSSKCTHKGGLVGLPGIDGIAICGLHKAAYDTNGEVTKGPAKENLTKFETVIKDGIIQITI